MRDYQILGQLDKDRTKTWVKTLYTLVFVFIYFAIIWILFGDFNLLKLNFVVYPGWVNPQNATQATTYAQIDPRLYYFLFLPGVFYVLSILALRFIFKQIAIDMIPVVLASWMAWVALILSGAFANPFSVLVLTGRIVLILTVFVVLFFVANLGVNYYLCDSQAGLSYFSTLVKQELANHKINDVIKNAVKVNGESVIDVDPRNIFRKIK